ncbi:hypothetical protein BJ166DRAFT_518372 [Pestalotiopsis sp. NC0098]|nr:hypothetical protein BJ166DRAFT_518372 [Pestalotiopsis sp. NC0098]
MEDSPLSIVASITGILTFIAAVVGFVYVRYSILNNGKQEIVSTKESVVAFLRDTASFQQMLLQPVVQQDSHSDLRQIILHELYTTELEILRLYRQSDFIGELRSILGDADAQKWREGLVAACFWERWNDSWDNTTTDVLHDRHVSPELLRNRIISRLRQDAEEAFRSRRRMSTKKRMDFVRGLIGISWLSFENMPEYAALVFGVVRLLFNFGATPRLLQWYMIREKVLEMVKVRENLRSRLLFYEVSTANLYVYFRRLTSRCASADTTRVAQKLLKENGTLKSDLDELRALTSQLHNSIQGNRIRTTEAAV